MSDQSAAWKPDIGSRLAVLRAELGKPNTDRVELPIPESPIECRIGMDIQGSVWIRIFCDPKSVTTDDQAAAVRFTMAADGYQVALAPQSAEVVVEHLLDEMVQLLIVGHLPGDVGRTALQNWRDLLARSPGRPLSEDALVGLFGELEVLASVLRHGGQLGHWTGWQYDHCDFRLPGLVVEVKSTTSSDYRRVRIHGLGQLADPEDGSELILVLKRLESSPTGRSVPDLVEEIVRLGVSRSKLLDQLSNLNYSDQHRALYDSSRFTSIEVALRRVDFSHPRLVPAMLEGVDLSSIDKIEYELNLNGDAEADLSTDLDTLIRDHFTLT